MQASEHADCFESIDQQALEHFGMTQKQNRLYPACGQRLFPASAMIRRLQRYSESFDRFFSEASLRIDINALPVAAQYKLICSTVIPRPIALVTTWSPSDGHNAAPFSYFNAMGENPPIMVLGIEHRPDSETLKDTGINIRDTGQFVINLVDEPIAEAMSTCAVDFPKGMSEIEAAGLSLMPSECVKPGRVAESPVSYECELMHWLHVSPRRYMAVGKVLMMHVRDGLYDPETGYIDHSKYKPVGRYFGRLYTKEHKVFEMPVPSYEQWLSSDK